VIIRWSEAVRFELGYNSGLALSPHDQGVPEVRVGKIMKIRNILLLHFNTLQMDQSLLKVVLIVGYKDG